MLPSKITRREMLRRSIGLAGILVATACSSETPTPTSATKADTPQSTAPTAAATAAAGSTTPTSAPAANAPTGGDKTRLLYWDGFGEESTGIDKIVAMFNQANPKIEIVREAQPQMRDILRTALDAGQGPDIFYYDTGPGFAGVLARAGLLKPLDDAYRTYDWDKRIFDFAKQRASFGGKAYGIGNELEFITTFYNKRIFQEKGLTEPKTHEEFDQVADQLKGAGLIPIAFGNQTKSPASHVFSVFSGNIAGREKLTKAISGKTPWNDPDFVRAIEIPFVEKNKKGYYPPGVNAITYDDVQSLFFSGKAAMSLTGTWQVNDYSNQENITDPVGMFFYPPIDGKPIAPPSGLGSGYFVSNKTEDPDAATRFLDFLFSEEAVKIWIEEMNMIPPVQLNPADYQVPELMRFTLETLQRDAEKMGYNINVLTPENFNNVMNDGFQEVLNGTKDAKQQADDLQKAMEEALAEGKVFDLEQ